MGVINTPPASVKAKTDEAKMEIEAALARAALLPDEAVDLLLAAADNLSAAAELLLAEAESDLIEAERIAAEMKKPRKAIRR